MVDGYSSLLFLLILVGIIAFFFLKIHRSVENLEEKKVGKKIKLLERLRHRDDFLIVDETGKTLLMQAVIQGFEEGVEEILASASSDAVNFATTDGTTALHSAVSQGNVSIVSRLLGAGADVNVRDASSVTPLWIAAHKEDAQIATLLLSAKADPNCRVGKYAMTPLMAAAKDGRSQVVEILLKAGADPQLVSKTGKNAADFAREYLAINQGPHPGQNRKLVEMAVSLDAALQKNKQGRQVWKKRGLM